VPGMSVVRRTGAALVALLASCGGTATPTTATTDVLRSSALAFALDADRALDGTRFEDVPVADLADAIVMLCTSDATVGEVIGGLGASDATVEGVEIAREVLIEAMDQVCPTRSGDAAAIDAYLSAARGAITSAGVALAFDDEPLADAGTSVCATLDAGVGAAEAVLVAAAGLYGVEATAVGELDALITGDQGVALGAVLASAATFLCPEHQQVVAEFVAGL